MTDTPDPRIEVKEVNMTKTAVTAVDIAALPIGTPVLDNEGDVWQKLFRGWATFDINEVTDADMAEEWAPLTILVPVA